MNKYEGMFLLDHSKVKNNPQKGIDMVSGVLEKYNANIHAIGKWDERKLAYEINRQKRGTYVLCHFEAGIEALDEIRRECSIHETINRQLILRIEEEFPPFMTASEIDAKFGTRAEFRDRAAKKVSEETTPSPEAAAPVAAPEAGDDEQKTD